MKRNTHAIVPEQRFRVTQGEDQLSCYTFNTRTAKHLFCRTCGVCPFYRPRSNPDGYAGRPARLRCLLGRRPGACAAPRATLSRPLPALLLTSCASILTLHMPAVTVHCITSPTVTSLTVRQIKGSDWEAAVEAGGIRQLSKS